MTFKKDYINYVIYSVLNGNEEFRANKRLKLLVGKILATEDIVKITFAVGKTAGLEVLFKYLLYISDKIDKSQITVFNLKDNFEYDVHNLVKVFEKLQQYQPGSISEKLDAIEPDEEILTEAPPVTEQTEETQQEETSEVYDDESPSLTLIENTGSGDKQAEVFELSEINEEIENTISEQSSESPEPETEAREQEEQTDDNIVESSDEVFQIEDIEEEAPVSGSDEIISEPELPPVEMEIRKPVREYDETEEVVKEESVTNEAYYKFESKFFEEVKILEKLFSTVEKESRVSEAGKPTEKCLQCLSEIIEITSELSNLSRQLSFDLIADIFLTMNLYYTKAINAPDLLTAERIRLLDSSLALVNSLIKGEDYLNYDIIVDRIEALKAEMQRPVEVAEEFNVKETVVETIIQEESAPHEAEEQEPQRPAMRQSELDSVNFKMRYLIKEFEKSFVSIGSIKGEYKRFDALDKIDELNNALRLIAKISSAVKMRDVMKLSEVSYVFLKYLKDYRMDLMDPEIQQIIKYIIFTFKMLLTDRKPEDFNVLVQYLNNPVKIFADS